MNMKKIRNMAHAQCITNPAEMRNRKPYSPSASSYQGKLKQSRPVISETKKALHLQSRSIPAAEISEGCNPGAPPAGGK